MKKLMVTGANGFIGVHALHRLEKLGYEVHGIALEGESLKEPAKGPDITWHRLDLMDELQRARIFDEVRPQCLLHLAWYTEHGKYWTADANLDWVRASLGMLKAFSRAGGERAVIAGTCAEYDWGRVQQPCIEDLTPTEPRTLYGASKNGLRLISSAFCRQNGISLAWGRIFQPFGPYEPRPRLVPSVILSLLRGEQARCTAGDQLRDFMHTGEVASAFAALLRSRVEGAVNIASGRPTAIKDLVMMMARKLGHPELLRMGAIPVAPDDPPALLADVKRLNGEVGWRPEGDMDAWLDRTIEWWRQNLPKQ